MLFSNIRINKKNLIETFLLIILCIVLVFILSSITNKNQRTLKNINEVKCKIIEVDNSEIVQSGIASLGFQTLEIEIKEGNHKGIETTATNSLIGKLDIDTIYKKGDIALVAIQEINNEVKKAVMLDLVRTSANFWLMIIFSILLIAFAKVIGARALLSFIASFFILWQVLIPSILNGTNPIIVTIIVLLLLNAIIIFSVAGFTRKGLSAFIGSCSGLIFTISLTYLLGGPYQFNGFTMPFSETLLFAGYASLDYKSIFYCAIIIGASGASMDIAMDISASMSEIKEKKPNIKMKELIQSGLTVGKAVIGTMSTTLLLAYSGSYLTLLMVFLTKETSFARIINLQMVSAEIFRTVIGSIGLVMIAPFTAFIAGIILSKQDSSLDTSQQKNQTLQK